MLSSFSNVTLPSYDFFEYNGINYSFDSTDIRESLLLLKLVCKIKIIPISDDSSIVNKFAEEVI